MICTVVIPCYNGEACLESAFHSVMSQTLRDFHLVLVDDASQDGTLALAQRLAAEHGNVSVISLPENHGRCHARNRGVKSTNSPFVAFLDQDDSYHPDFLRATSQILRERPDVDAVRVLPNVSVEVHPRQYESIAVSLTNTMVFRRTAFDFVGGWPEREVFRELVYGGEDVALRSLFTMLFREAVLDKPLYNYAWRPGNALDEFLRRSEVVNDQLTFSSGREESDRLREEIERLKEELAERLRQFVYRNWETGQRSV